MSGFRWSKMGVVLAIAIGIAILGADLVQAQEIKPPEKALISRRFAASQLDDVLLAKFYDQADGTFGAALKPVSDTLRAQLNIPAGQGLLVASLRDDSPSAQAGLKQNDVLLSLADKPLAAADDLTKQLRAAGEAAVTLKLLRAGKPMVLQVRPVYRVTLGPVQERQTEYYIGVSIDPVDEALRAQLALPADQGAVISDVISGSPAEKAGVQKNDIVLEMGGKRIDSLENLAKLVQATQDKPTLLKVLRAGKPVTIPITGALRKVESSPPQDAFLFWTLGQAHPINLTTEGGRRTHFRAWVDDRERLDYLDKELKALHRIESLEKELQALREALEKVNETLKAGKGTKRD